MSFLDNYLKFNECNEAHTNYHVWAGLVALASIVGRRVWIDYGHQYIYPQLYVVLVGPPGNRKSTAMYIAKDFMREVGDSYFAAQLESREGLIKQMASNEVSFLHNGTPRTYMPMTICVGELKDFLGVSMINMINFTTAVWDSDYYDYKLRNKEDIIIVNPYLCILACDTPQWITNRLRDDVISGGFSRRTLFVYETDKAREIPFPEVTTAQRAAWAASIEYARQLKGVAGQFKWTPDSRAFFSKWYSKKKLCTDLALQGYFDSKHVLVLKVAMLLSLSENFSLVIEERHLRAALELLELVEQKLPLVFQGIGRNELTQVTNKLTDLLKLHRTPMREKDLRAAMWRDATGREFDEVIAHLTRSDQIVHYKQGDRTMVCLKEFAPSNVLQALSRAEETSSGSSATDGQPDSPAATHDDLALLIRASRPNVPTASVVGSSEPPKAPPVAGTSTEASPST